jgi:hypothetical protein
LGQSEHEPQITIQHQDSGPGNSVLAWQPNLGWQTALLPRANLKVVSEFSYCGSGFVTTQDLAGYDESESTSLVEQHRPIDENLDPFTHWKKLIGLQKHAAAADVQRCGLCSISSQDVF